MKVLVVYHFIANYREAVFKELVKNGDFYFFSDTRTKTDIKLIDDSFYQNERFIKSNNVYLPFGALWQRGLIKEIVKGGYSHVVFLGDPYFLTTWISLLLTKFTRVKTFLWTHGFINRSGFILDSVKKIMFRLADGIMLYGNESKDDLLKCGFPKDKLHVIYNSLDYRKQIKFRKLHCNSTADTLREKYFGDSECIPLIFIGRLTYHKKLDMLIKSLNIIKSCSEKSYKVIFVGNGEAKSELVDLVTSLGLENDVLFYGSCHNEEELSPLLNMSFACVAPGEIGLTAMHCAAYGLPIVTHNNSLKQMPEYEIVIDDFSGYLFDYGSVTSLVNAIKKIKADSKQSLGKNAIELVEKYYTPKKQADFIRDALNEK